MAREMGGRLVTNPEFTEHQIVLGANLMHLEHVVNLSAIQQDRVFLVGWPLRLPGADGGPASPIALTEWPGPDPRITDLSLPVTENWMGKVSTGLAKSFEAGDPVQESKVRFEGHSHTHVLTPKYVGDGPGVDQFMGSPLVRHADVAVLSDVASGEAITAQQLEAALPAPNPENVLLLHTGHTEGVPYDDPAWYASSPSLGEDAAIWILDAGYSVVGADFEMEIGRKEFGAAPVRKTDIKIEAMLLDRGVCLLKHLFNLRGLNGTSPLVVALPLNLKDAEAAPARVIAIEW